MELDLYTAKLLETGSYNLVNLNGQFNQLHVFINKAILTLLMIWFVRLFK
jgi:hypothetical protein